MRQPSLILVSFLFLTLVQATNVTWASPSAGDVFGPGDMIVARWNSVTAIKSASFRLCENELVNGTSSCGSSISPLLQQSAGSYLVSFSSPNVSRDIGFHLQMKANGKTIGSPNFSLSPFPVPTNATSSLVNTTQLNPQLSSDPIENHAPPPTAAFVIPLSVVGAILLASLFLCFHHRRKLNKERALDAQKLNMAQGRQIMQLISPSTTAGAPSIIYLSSSASLDRMYTSKGAKDNIFDPAYKLSAGSLTGRRESVPRIATREAFPIHRTASPVASAAHHKRSLYASPACEGNDGSTKVPAGLFKTAYKSPIIHHPPPPGLVEEEKETNATVNNSLISNYLASSPVPPCLSPGKMPAQPGRLHVRNEASSTSFDSQKALPSSPRPRYSDQTAYDAVAHAIQSRETR